MAFVLSGVVVSQQAATGLSVPTRPLKGGYAFAVTDHRPLMRGIALPWGLAAWVEQISRSGRAVYLEAEFFGGTGAQAAIGFEGGTALLGPLRTQSVGESLDGFTEMAPGDTSAWAINQALGWLGVERGVSTDEFDALGLDQAAIR